MWISKSNLYETALWRRPQLLARLLKSTCPEDLQTANRLIKNTIQEVRVPPHPPPPPPPHRGGAVALLAKGFERHITASPVHLRRCVLVSQEQEKAARESRRGSTLKEVETSVSKLGELLAKSSRTGAPVQHSEELRVWVVLKEKKHCTGQGFLCFSSRDRFSASARSDRTLAWNADHGRIGGPFV